MMTLGSRRRRPHAPEVLAMVDQALEMVDAKPLLSVLEMAWPAVGDILRLTAEYLGDQVPDSTGAPLLHRCVRRFVAEAHAWRVTGASSKVLRRSVVSLLVSAQDVADTRVRVNGVVWNPCRGVPLLAIAGQEMGKLEVSVSPGAWSRPLVMRAICSHVMPASARTAMGSEMSSLFPEGDSAWRR